MNEIMKRQTLADLVLEYPAHRAQEQVLIFLDSAGNEKKSFTFESLKTACLETAAYITARVAKGTPVLMVLEDQADFVKGFFGCVLSGCIPAPLPGFSKSQHKKSNDRALQILKQRQISTVLTAADQVVWLEKRLLDEGLTDVLILTIESCHTENRGNALPVLAADDTAYLQYTSGATARPKGVILHHKNVLDNLAKMYRVFNRGTLVRVVGWLPFHHDMGLVGHLFTVLYESGRGIFMPPETFLADPAIWLQAISRYKGNSSAAPAFAFAHCIQKAASVKDLDLSTWKNVYVGAETVPLSVLDRFSVIFKKSGFNRNAFRPVYGLAETTLLVAGGDKGLDELQDELLNIKSGAGERVLIPYHLDKDHDEVSVHDEQTGDKLPEGTQGEIWVKATYNSSGYFQHTNDEATADGVIRTGDLGIIQNDSLYITGRVKDLIIIRGVNYTAEDLEAAIQQENDLFQTGNATVCVADFRESGDRFFVFQEMHRHTDAVLLRNTTDIIRTRLSARFGILPDEVILVPKGCVPRTSSYKVKRRDCLDQYLDGKLPLLLSTEANIRKQETGNDPVVIVGVACRFPGGADTPQKFWDLLYNGKDAITEIPADRGGADLFYDPRPAVPGKANTKWGGFIDQIDYFDPALFGISHFEALEIDPQQRILLETSWRLIEQAGWKKEQLADSDTGVFIGMSGNDYLHMKIKLTAGMESFNAYSGLGNANSVAANRLSYFYDLKGPSMAVDTACSSSLTAFHLAVQAIRNGECTQAIAGGVNAILTPGATITLSQFGMMAPDGHCKTFDAAADGYVRAEGCGLVMLKKQSAALRDGDNILAVVAATVAGQDGNSAGITYPNGEAQYRLISRALAQAGLTGNDINYIEAHGTGTASGDPVEMEQLIKLYGKAAGIDPCYVGGVKANIGHLEAGAGIAGIIKSVLMIQHGYVPPQIHLNNLNPRIALEHSRLSISREAIPWQVQGKRRAAVSSFGFGGALAHAILEAPESATIKNELLLSRQTLFPLSAVTPEGLMLQAGQWSQWLQSEHGVSLADICYTQSVARTDLKYRQAFLVQSVHDLQAQLAAFVALPVSVKPPVNNQKTAFLFTGQGEHYRNMGNELYETFPVFRAAFDRCAAVYDPGETLSLKELAFEIEELEEQNTGMQSVHFAIQYALGVLWQECGVIPHVLIGHSLGEYAAAALAGCFEPETGMLLVKKRANIINAIKGPRGIMAAIFASAGEILDVMDSSDAKIAAINSAQKTVVSGTIPEIDRLVNLFKARNVKAYYLRTTQAFHSHLMDPAIDEFRKVFEGISLKAPAKNWISSVTGKEITDVPDAEYWIAHLRNTVRFDEAINQLKPLDITGLIEIGPGASLLAAAYECLEDTSIQLLRSLNIKKGDRTEIYNFLDSAGRLYQQGASLNWQVLQQGHSRPQDIPGQAFVQKAYRAEGLEPYRMAQFVGKDIQVPVSVQEEAPLLNGVDHYKLTWNNCGPLPVIDLEAELSKDVNWIIAGPQSRLAGALALFIKGKQKNVSYIGLDQPGASFDNRPDITVPRNATVKEYYNILDKLVNRQARENNREWNVLFVAGDDDSDRDPQDTTDSQFEMLIPLVRAMSQQAMISPLWVITQQSQLLPETGQQQINMQQSAVWGFAKTLFLEHPEWRGGMIDTDLQDNIPSRVTQILRKVLQPGSERCVAMRSGGQYAEWIERTEPVSHTAPAFRADGAYIITGGAGGLGLKCAQWIIEKGGRHLVLINRSRIAPQNEWATLLPEHKDYRVVQQLIALKEQGAEIETVSLDVCNVADLKQLLVQLNERNVRIRGVVHAAGVNWFSKIKELDTERFLKTLRIKVAASWALHELTAKEDLDCFILFSSVSAVWGSVDLSHYTAANHFMDALSLYRSGLGLPSLSVNWGPWDEVGMSAYDTEKDVLHKLGFRLMPPAAAIAGMETELAAKVPLMLIADVDWHRFRTFIEFSLQPSLFNKLIDADTEITGTAAKPVLSDLDPVAAREKIEATVRLVLRRVMLLESIEKIDAEQRFNFLGMDSLMAISFVAELELCFNCKLPPTLSYNYPHIKAVTEYIFDLLYIPPAAQQASEPQADKPVEAVSETSSDWLKILKPAEGDPLIRLICFPYAGSGASAYQTWIPHFAANVELIAVQPPGREERAGTPAFTSMPELIEALLKYLPEDMSNCYFFGHSLGAIMAYECYLALKRKDKTVPVKLILSGCNAPLLPSEGRVHQLHGADFIEEILRNYDEEDRNDRRAAINRQEDLLRSDIQLLESYQPSGTIIEIPLVIISGLKDTIATPAGAKEWVRLTASNFSMHYLNGGHDLMRRQKTELIHIVKQAIKSLPAGKDTLIMQTENDN